MNIKPYDEVKKLRAQADTLYALIEVRIMEVVGKPEPHADNTQHLSWLERSGNNVIVKYARSGWTSAEREDLGTLIRELGFTSVIVYNKIGNWMFTS